MTVKDIVRFRRPRIFRRSGVGRGMGLWTDVADWVGGYPFEVASPRQIVDFYQRRGFTAKRIVDVGRKHGCNVFVFQRTS